MSCEPFTKDEISTIRTKAREILSQLETKQPALRSWINAGAIPADAADSRSSRCKYFDTNGFIKVDHFADDKEVKALRTQMQELADQWDPSTGIDSFGTSDKENKSRGDYFLESASKVHFFAESSALVDGNKLSPEFQNDKMGALNKSGHAMHRIPGSFREYTLSDKVRSLVLELGWKDPVVPQSMYIFKQKKIGGPVTSHQDSTFLYTEPKQSCLGLWLALHDATIENGCLWVRPESHWEQVRRQYKRNSLHFGEAAICERSNAAAGDISAPKFVMEQLNDNHNIQWEGGIPEGGFGALFDAGFVPVECKAGDLLAFNGELDHLSLPNYSDKPRHTFQLHLIEGEKAGVTWSKSNWLQYPRGIPFVSLIDDSVSNT